MTSLVANQPVTISVSSTSDPKLFGKKCMIDGREDTCWSSDQGQVQWLRVKFSNDVIVKELHLMFQGGFTSRTIKLTFFKNDQHSNEPIEIHPQDMNSIQSFKIADVDCDSIRLEFIDFNDFYGRIVVYKLDIIGENKSPN